jgi:hypothetical protein
LLTLLVLTEFLLEHQRSWVLRALTRELQLAVGALVLGRICGTGNNTLGIFIQYMLLLISLLWIGGG